MRKILLRCLACVREQGEELILARRLGPLEQTAQAARPADRLGPGLIEQAVAQGVNPRGKTAEPLAPAGEPEELRAAAEDQVESVVRVGRGDELVDECGDGFLALQEEADQVAPRGGRRPKAPRVPDVGQKGQAARAADTAPGSPASFVPAGKDIRVFRPEAGGGRGPLEELVPVRGQDQGTVRADGLGDKDQTHK